ncbi:hypothetical protein CsSME_00030242 [Camellia sinensis var. sinensis]
MSSSLSFLDLHQILTGQGLSGVLPRSIVKLPYLKTMWEELPSSKFMCFEGNMFNGTVPAELGNLVDLLYLRLSSNNFNGKLPSFQSCEQLRILELEASGFEGPIPSGVSLLLNLTEIRITDLNGGASEFPKLENMTALEKLMLRNCNISGTIPIYFMTDYYIPDYY